MDVKQKEALQKPLPPEAISPHPSKSFLSAIKAIYVVERLNEVFGIGGWKVENEFVERVDKMVVIKARFTSGDIYIENFGGNDNADLGDAYKGACTDALTKIGSYLEIGMDVFKGKGNKSYKPNPQPLKAGIPITPEERNPVVPTNYKKDDDNDKQWITDELFEDAIKKSVNAGVFKVETDDNEVMKILRMKYKVAKKYQAMVASVVNKYALLGKAE